MRSFSLFQTVWKHRHLLWQFTVRQVELRHKGTHLGLVWSILSPLLLVSLYVMVFGFILQGRFQGEGAETRIEYALVLFLGLAIYHFVAEVATTAPTLVTTNPNFVKKVVFPLEILPVASVGAAAFHLLITLGLVLSGAALAGVPLHATIFYLPLLLIPVMVAAAGLALGLAALGVFWRDISQVTQFLVLALLFASAVFYPVSKVPPEVWAFLKFNPLVHVIDEARKAVFWGQPLNAIHLTYVYVFSFGALVTGGTLFQRLRGSFADVL